MRTAIFAVGAVLSIASLTLADDVAVWKLQIPLKARTLTLDPRTGDRREVFDELDLTGLHSPDGKRTAFIGSDPQRVKAGHDFDLFIAELDANEPSGKRNIRRVTTDQVRPVHHQWLADGSGLIFIAGEPEQAQVWSIDLGPQSVPVRLSDGQGRCSQLSILADGRLAWILHHGSRNKQQVNDLVIHPSPAAAGKIQTMLTGEHISSYAFSPDGTTLAWSGLGSMFLVDLATGESRDVPLHGIHRQLLNHTVHQFSWRPDGKVIAIRCGFLGGISRGLNSNPNEPWPPMFAEDKIFFVPVNWTPTPESLVVGEGAAFPSPMVDELKAETSPPVGDESKPWWIREVESPTGPLRWRAN
jgi:Tol biopolymer transport system component